MDAATIDRRSMDPAGGLVSGWAAMMQGMSDHAGVASDFGAFLKTCARDPEGKPLREDAFTRFMVAAVPFCYDRGLHISQVAFPGLGKSTLARWFTVYSLGNDTKATIVFTSADKTTARSSVSFCREVIVEPSTKVRSVFPDIIPDFERSQAQGSRGWNQDKFYLKNQGIQAVDASMEAVAGKPRGEARRIDILIVDDFMTREIATSARMRSEYCRALNFTWLEGRLSNFGWAWAMQNCWHADDAGHRFKKDSRFVSIWTGIRNFDHLFVRIWNAPEDFPLLERPEDFEAVQVSAKDEAQAEFELPFPEDNELFNAERFRSMSENMVDADGNRYDQTYTLKAMTDKDRMFPKFREREKYPGTVAEMMKVKEDPKGLPIFSEHDGRRLVFAGGIDLAGKDRPGDSIHFYAKDGLGKKYPIEHWRGNYTMDEIVAIINNAWNRGIRFSLLYVENNAQQAKIVAGLKILAKHEKYEWVYRVKGFETGKNKADPMLGLAATDVEIGTGGIIYPGLESSRRDVDHAHAWKVWETEMNGCPKIIPAGETPDSVMSDWFALRAMDKVSPPDSNRGITGIGPSSHIASVVDRFF